MTSGQVVPLGTLPCSNNPVDYECEEIISAARPGVHIYLLGLISNPPSLTPYSSCGNQACGGCKPASQWCKLKHLTTDPGCLPTISYRWISLTVQFGMLMGTHLALMHM